MYYHASPAGGIRLLKPHVSDHGIPLIYFSKKRENVLVYLSNAIEKYCRESGFAYNGIWKKWGPYGFEKDGRQRIEEYYPDALESTYRGVPGYIYSANELSPSGFDIRIPDAAVSSEPVPVDEEEFIPDAMEAILQAERDGLLTIVRYGNMPGRMKEWLIRTTREEYEKAKDHPEYRFFLEAKFPEYL